MSLRKDKLCFLGSVEDVYFDSVNEHPGYDGSTWKHNKSGTRNQDLAASKEIVEGIS